jgi:hypothetical protein
VVGEELTHSYTDVTNCRDIRQHNLLSVYGFRCQCQRCAFSPSLSSTAQTAERGGQLCELIDEPYKVKKLLDSWRVDGTLNNALIEALITFELTSASDDVSFYSL